MIRIRNVNILVSLGLTFFATFSLEAAAEVTHTTHQATCTLANGDVKTMNMHIWYPDNQGGPYPLLVFAHGNLVGSPTQCPYLTKGMAENGYVVCATTHSNSVNSAEKPQGTDTAPGYLGLPLEIKAEIDEMLRLNRETGSIVYGMIDEDNIGVSGHSHGGWSTEVVCGAAPDELYVDKRVKAGFFLEPANAYGVTGTPMAKEASANMHTASMWWFGTLDELVQPAINKFPYTAAPAPKYCAVVSGLDHFGAAMGSSGLNAVTGKYALAFFNRYLKEDTSAEAILAEATLEITHSSFASYEYETSPDISDNDDGDDDDSDDDEADNKETLNATTATIDTSYTLSDGTIKPLRITVWRPQNGSANKAYPLVVFSHGALMGYASQSTYITSGLAKEGYIVCATTHEDSTYYRGEKDTSPLTQGYWDRPLDVQTIITEMLNLNSSPQSTFYKTIDEQAIGVMGHSYGGWTSEVIGGAVTPEQQAYADSRTKAAVLFAPANHRMTKEAAENIRVPTLFLFAENDTLAPPSANKFAYDCAPAPKYMGILSDFGHFDFADMGRSKPQAEVVTRYTIAFFNRYLKGDSSAEDTLLMNDPLFVSYEYDSDAGEVSTINTAATNTTENTEQNRNTTTSNSNSGSNGNNQDSLLSNKSLANCPIVKALKQMQQKSQNGDNAIGKTGSIVDTFKKRMEEMKSTIQDKLGNISGNNTSLNDKIKEVKDKIGGIFEGKGIILDDKLNIFTTQENRPTDKLADPFTNDTGSNLDKMNTSRLFEKMKNISPSKNILTMVSSLKDTAKLSSNTTTSNNSSLSGSSSTILTSFTTGIISAAKQGLSSLKLGSGSPLVTGLFGQGLGKLSTFNFGLLSGKLRQ